MTKQAAPFAEQRQAAIAKGKKRFNGFQCSECGGTERFTHNNACCECKRTADRERYHKISFTNRSYIVEHTDCTISEQANRLFLSALAREKAGIKDE